MSTAAREVDVARRLAGMIRREVRERLGPHSTFEQRRDGAAALTTEALWHDTDEDLREAIMTAEEIEVEGRRYRKLGQDSSATYCGRWGSHHVEEACTMGRRSSRSSCGWESSNT